MEGWAYNAKRWPSTSLGPRGALTPSHAPFRILKLQTGWMPAMHSGCRFNSGHRCPQTHVLPGRCAGILFLVAVFIAGTDARRRMCCLTNMLVRPRTHAHTRTQTHTHTRTHTRAQAHTHTRTQAHKHTCANAHVRAHAQTHRHIHTSAHTQTHEGGKPFPSSIRSCFFRPFDAGATFFPPLYYTVQEKKFASKLLSRMALSMKNVPNEVV